MKEKFVIIVQHSNRIIHLEKKKTCSDGYRGKCKDCERPMRHLHYINNKEKYKQAYQEFQLRNPSYKSEYNFRKKYHN